MESLKNLRSFAGVLAAGMSEAEEEGETPAVGDLATLEDLKVRLEASPL